VKKKVDFEPAQLDWSEDTSIRGKIRRGQSTQFDFQNLYSMVQKNNRAAPIDLDFENVCKKN